MESFKPSTFKTCSMSWNSAAQISKLLWKQCSQSHAKDYLRYSFNHVLREVNDIADSLAREGASS